MSKNTKYWFKRKRYGFGWTPASHEAWFVVVIFFLVTISDAYIFIPADSTSLNDVALFLLAILMNTIIFLGITILKSPVPKWRWGKKPTDNPKEDY